MIVSSIDKAQILDDLNTFEILVNKQFSGIPLMAKFALLKVATAQNVEEIDTEELQLIENSLSEIGEVEVIDDIDAKKIPAIINPDLD